MQLKVTCPKCRKIETITINNQMLREIHTIGYTSISFYHNNHVLYVGLDKYGIKIVDTFDPPSTFVFSSNLVVDGVFIIRNPIIPSPINLLFYDMKKKLLDARFLDDHMHAIVFARYFKHLNDKEGIVTTLGLKYYIRRNSHIVIASILNKRHNSQEITDKLLETIRDVPPNPEDIWGLINSRFH